MARETFISYKYSEAQGTRDKILESLGSDATYYRGETSASPDLTDSSTEAIKRTLADMIFETSVLILVVSPNMRLSTWIDWEVEYCLKEMTRKNRTSKTNGVVGVVQEVNGRYDWLVTTTQKSDGCSVRSYNESKLYSIVTGNRYNRKQKSYACATCQTFGQLDGSYISFVDESAFLAYPETYIENAYGKSEDYLAFDLVKQR
jgi:hypothetical protein